MKKIDQKPGLDFTANRLLRKVFAEYDVTYSLTLDTCDYIENRDLKLFRKFVRKQMKKSLKKVPSTSKKIRRFIVAELDRKALKVSENNACIEKLKKFKENNVCILKCHKLGLKVNKAFRQRKYLRALGC